MDAGGQTVEQARERLGVAAPDEVVIRVEPGVGAAGSGSGPAPLFRPAAAPESR